MLEIIKFVLLTTQSLRLGAYRPFSSQNIHLWNSCLTSIREIKKPGVQYETCVKRNQSVASKELITFSKRTEKSKARKVWSLSLEVITNQILILQASLKTGIWCILCIYTRKTLTLQPNSQRVASRLQVFTQTYIEVFAAVSCAYRLYFTQTLSKGRDLCFRFNLGFLCPWGRNIISKSVFNTFKQLPPIKSTNIPKLAI